MWFWIFDEHLLSEMAWPENLEFTCIFCLIYLGTSSVWAGLWESMKGNFRDDYAGFNQRSGLYDLIFFGETMQA
jgi:hypothetical protein